MKIAPLIQVDWDYYTRFMDVNMNGALRCVRACYRSMRERGGGAIVNQSSTAAWMGMGFYGVAKLGLNGITQSLARELGPMKIRVNAIAPGPTDTEATRSVVPKAALDHILAQMPLARQGRPEDLVGTLLFLLSDAASWLTGQIVNVDGGQIMRP
jgi:NAD(P)-dependent dehydrogenase (short-subunit alcohol dehydrogenase family)